MQSILSPYLPTPTSDPAIPKDFYLYSRTEEISHTPFLYTLVMWNNDELKSFWVYPERTQIKEAKIKGITTDSNRSECLNDGYQFSDTVASQTD